ncbi:uncharacterized protein LOC107264352 isoform X2 [Cephus cinctus]|nr:uncharacterized protein LOC107264352 isoform X2 [Cephus cinctus]
MYDVQFIKDCVMWKEIGDLHKYKLGPRKAYDGCIMSIFLYGSPSCMYRCVSNPCPQNNICSSCGSRNTFEILDLNYSPMPSKNASDEWRVITSNTLYKKGFSDAKKSLKSVSRKHPSLLQDETEVSPKLKKLQTNGNASSQEVSSIYKTVEHLINYSPDSNLLLTQATQDGIDKLHTDTESRTIVTQQAIEIDQLDSDSQRSVKRAVDHAKHKSHHDTSEIIRMSSDSKSDQLWNLEKKFSVLQCGNAYKISNLPDVELIRVVNTSAKEHESYIKDESKKKAEKDVLVTYKLKSHEQEKKEFEETSVSSIIKNSLKSRARTNAKSARKWSRVSSEEEESPRSNNGKDHDRCDCGERKRKISRKDKEKSETSLIKREYCKIPQCKNNLPTCNASVDGNPTLNKDPQSNEDSTGSVTDPEGIFSDEANRILRPRTALPNKSYVVSSDDSDDVNEPARLKNTKSRIKKDNSEDEDPTVFISESEISDDSDAVHHIKVKDESNNASYCPVRSKLNINSEKNGKSIKTNLNLQEWLTWAKHKAQNLAAPRTRNFAKWEKLHMLIFLIENDFIDHAKGLDVWHHMIQREDCGQRTKMSLQNHFIKYILPCIEEFRLPKDIETKFLTLRNIKDH